MAALMASPNPCAAQAASTERDSEARREFRLAEAHFNNGQFAEAARGFTRAYQLSARPALLYNMYIAYRDANDLPRARDALAAFIEHNPDDSRGDQLKARLAVLVDRFGPARPIEEILEEPKGPAPDAGADAGGDDAASVATPEPAREATEPAPEPGESAAPAGDAAESAADDDGIPVPVLALWGAGAALIIGGTVTGIVTMSSESELESKCDGSVCPESLEGTRDTGETMAVVTDVLLGVGIAAVAAGGILFLMNDDASEAQTATGVGCDSHGCLGSIRVSF